MQVNQEELEAAQVFVWVGVTVQHPVGASLAWFPVLHVHSFTTSARLLVRCHLHLSPQVSAATRV